MYRMTGRLPVVLALTIALAAGCGSDEATEPNPIIGPEPDTPDELITYFMTAYESMDAAGLATLLSGNHVTILQAATVGQFPDLGPTLDRSEEALIHERMFSRQAVTDPDGHLIPAIESIAFQTFARQGTWGLSPPTDPIPDTACALYDVVVLFDRGGLYSTLKVQGAVKFYVASFDSTANGQTRTLYRLRGQLDLTTDMAKAADTESASWGTIKALFRGTAP